MKTIKKWVTIFVLSLFLTSFSSCDETLEDCQEILNVDYKPLKSDGATYSLKNVAENKEVNLIISSQSDYQKYVSSNLSLPQIDFYNNILVCGKIYLSSCASLKNQSFIKRCNTLTYQVQLERRDCQKPEEIFHFAIIPKNLETLKIIFETQIGQ